METSRRIRKLKRIAALLVTTVALGLVGARAASAEWFLDVFAGAALTQSSDVTITNALGLNENFTLKDVAFDTSPSFGGRIGYWFSGFPIGLGLDVGYFRPDIKKQSTSVSGFAAGIAELDSARLDITTVGFDLMARLPLVKSTEFPQGRVQPYVTAGPAVFLSNFEGTSNTSLGLKVGTGVTWMLFRNFGVFAEYRFTHVHPEFEDSGVKLKTDLNTHHVLGGVTLRF